MALVVGDEEYRALEYIQVTPTFSLEGGYDLDVLGYGVLACFRVLLGEEEIEDPFGSSPWPSRPVEDLLEQIKGVHRLV